MLVRWLKVMTKIICSHIDISQANMNSQLNTKKTKISEKAMKEKKDIILITTYFR